MSATGAPERKRLMVMGEAWVSTTLSAHRALRRLPAPTDPPLDRAALLEVCGQVMASVALDLLEKGGLANPTDAGKILWCRTERGDQFLKEIEREWKLLAQQTDTWLREQGIEDPELGPVRESLLGAIERAFSSGRIEVAGLASLPELVRYLASHLGDSPRASRNQELLRAAADALDRGEVCPLGSIVCRNALEVVFQDFYESKPPESVGGRACNILLDTNMFMRLMCPTSREYADLVHTLTVLPERWEVSLYVAEFTLAEARQVLKAGESHINAMMSALRGHENAPGAHVSVGANPFVLQYIHDFAGHIPYRLYADREYLHILSALGPRRSPDCDCGPEVSDRLPSSMTHRELPQTITLIRPREGLQSGFLTPPASPHHEVTQWPDFEGAFQFMRQTGKSKAASNHDALLLTLAAELQQSSPDAHWIIWTSDCALIQFERNILRLATKANRLVRDSRMMRALWPCPPGPEEIRDEVMESLASWAVATDRAEERLGAAQALRTAEWGTYSEAMDLIARALGDPYGVLSIMREDAIEHELEGLPAEQEQTPAVRPRDETTAAAEARGEVPKPGWPTAVDATSSPSPRSLPDSNARLNQLALLSGEGRYLELSGDLSAYIAAHGPLPLTVGDRVQLCQGSELRSRYTEFQIGVHSVAHMDLPWAISDVPTGCPVPDLRKSADSADGKALQHRLLRPQERPAVVVDLRYKATALYGMVEEMSAGSGEWVLSRHGRANIGKVLRSLWVSAPELQQRVFASLGTYSLTDSWVVLHTGWPELFGPVWPDVSTPGFECWHAWTLHPYIDDRSAEWLANLGVHGVAIDAAMVDCPAYMLPRSVGIAGDLAPARMFLRQNENSDERDPKLPAYQPGHMRLLLAGHVMLESITIPSALLAEEVPSYEKEGVLVTRLFTAGLGMPQMTDAALVKAFLRLPSVD